MENEILEASKIAWLPFSVLGPLIKLCHPVNLNFYQLPLFKIDVKIS